MKILLTHVRIKSIQYLKIFCIIVATMKNVVLISADFPKSYYQFAQAFKNNGCTVLVVGSTPYNDLHPGLISAVTEYYQTYEMENSDRMVDILNYFQSKYGPIDFLESNNEYWLRYDSILRERLGIRSGLYPRELDEFQKKSSMKKAFMEAGLHVAPFIVTDNLDKLKDFALQYGYPLFAKPDIGVGAHGNYKIENEEQLINFVNNKAKIDYIVEAFVEGQIVTFDGIADGESNVVICANEIFPRNIFNLHITHDDMAYYVNDKVPENLEKLGRKMIKCFGLKNRFFHTELFIADNEVEGQFKKGDIVALEINIRTPGGFTPDLLNFALSTNLYQMFADVVCFGSSNVKYGPRYYAVCSSRRAEKQYFFSEDDIKRTYKNNLCAYGDYPKVFSDLMGDKYYMAKFEEEKDVKIFEEYVKRPANMSYQEKTTINHLGGEDKRMMDEKNGGMSRSDDLTICDKHIDGA